MSPLRSSFLKFADRVHAANVVVCATLLLALFAAQLLVVVLRYAFSTGFLELQDLVAYAFAFNVVLAVPVALRTDRHVRVDIMRSRQPRRVRRRIDLAGILLLLFPVFGMTLVHSMPGIVYSWSILEGSIETGGLPGYFLVKTALPLACCLMLIQGAATALRPGSEADAA